MQRRGGSGDDTRSSNNCWGVSNPNGGGGTFLPRRNQTTIPKSISLGNSQRTVLKGTSQGRKIDLPPNYWIPEELIRFGVRGTLNVQPSNLTGNPHPIFAKGRWPLLSDERFNALEQTNLLATRLLEVGLPLLTRMVPKLIWRTGAAPQQGTDFGIIETEKGEWTVDDIQQARATLSEISTRTEWREDKDMLKKRGWWGINVVEFPRPETLADAEFNPDEIGNWDETWRGMGLSNRECTIGLASQYIDTLLASAKNSEQHLCTSFHCAVTLVHEIAHLIFGQDVANFLPVEFLGQMDPSFGNDCRNELGVAFTSRIFGGWYPEEILLDKAGDYGSFTGGLCWHKQPAGPQERPIWQMEYSMPFSHVQRLMTQSTWDELQGKLHSPRDTLAVLAPDWPFREGRDARTATCQKRVSAWGDGWEWLGGEILQDYTYKTGAVQDDDEFGTPDPNNPPFEILDSDWLELGGQIGKLGDLVGEVQIIRPSRRRRRPLGGLSPSFHSAQGKFNQGQSNQGQSNQGQSNHGQTHPEENVKPKVDQNPARCLVSIYYRGCFDASTGDVEPPSRKDLRSQSPEELEEVVREEPARNNRKLNDYSRWPEGVIRGRCLHHKLSTLGTKDQLVDRMKGFDSAAQMPPAPGEPVPVDDPEDSVLIEIMSSHEDLSQIHFVLDVTKTTVQNLKRAIQFITSIPIPFQSLTLPSADGKLIELEADGRDPPRDCLLVNYLNRGYKLDALELCRVVSTPGTRPPLPAEGLSPLTDNILPYGYIAADLSTRRQVDKWLKKIQTLLLRNNSLRQTANDTEDKIDLAMYDGAEKILVHMRRVAKLKARALQNTATNPPPPPPRKPPNPRSLPPQPSYIPPRSPVKRGRGRGRG